MLHVKPILINCVFETALFCAQMPSTLPLYSYTNGWPLTTVCMWIFRAHDVLNATGISSYSMEKFLCRVEAGYLSQNSYHNRVHAADVTMQLYSLLRNSFELQAMSLQEASRLLLTCVLAAAIHDFMHPGSNNQ